MSDMLNDLHLRHGILGRQVKKTRIDTNGKLCTCTCGTNIAKGWRHEDDELIQTRQGTVYTIDT